LTAVNEFRIASITKMFTAAMILQLFNAKKITIGRIGILSLFLKNHTLSGYG